MASEFGLFGAQNGEKLCGRAKKKTLRETPKRSFTVSNRQSSHFSQAGKPLHYKASVYCAVDVRGIAV